MRREPDLGSLVTYVRDALDRVVERRVGGVDFLIVRCESGCVEMLGASGCLGWILVK